MGLEAGLQHQPERADGVVVVMTGDFLAQARGPVLTGLLADFPQTKFPKPGPGLLKLLQASQPVLFAPGCHPRFAGEVPLEQFHRGAELGGWIVFEGADAEGSLVGLLPRCATSPGSARNRR